MERNTNVKQAKDQVVEIELLNNEKVNKLKRKCPIVKYMHVGLHTNVIGVSNEKLHREHNIKIGHTQLLVSIMSLKN